MWKMPRDPERHPRHEPGNGEHAVLTDQRPELSRSADEGDQIDHPQRRAAVDLSSQPIFGGAHGTIPRPLRVLLRLLYPQARK